jgi:hypothetical protein
MFCIWSIQPFQPTTEVRLESMNLNHPVQSNTVHTMLCNARTTIVPKPNTSYELSFFHLAFPCIAFPAQLTRVSSQHNGIENERRTKCSPNDWTKKASRHRRSWRICAFGPSKHSKHKRKRNKHAIPSVRIDAANSHFFGPPELHRIVHRH